MNLDLVLPAFARATIEQMREHLVICGYKSWRLKRFHPHPSDEDQIGVLDHLVHAGMQTSTGHLGHHGSCILAVACALFHPAAVEEMLAVERRQGREDGWAGAVVSMMRAVQNIEREYGDSETARKVFEVCDHIFDNAEVRRAKREIGGPWGGYMLPG